MTHSESEGHRRKRAAIACDYCRRRKRRCDGKQPICSLCQQTNRPECRYSACLPNHPEVTSTAPDSEIPYEQSLLSSIARLEEVVEAHTVAIQALRMEIDQAKQHSANSFPDPSPLSCGTRVQVEGTQTARNGRLALSYSDEIIPMSIPIRHMTTSDSLLLTSNAQVLAGEWPADVFLKSEQKRQSLSQTSSAACGELSLPSESSIPHAVQIYFTKVHPRHPILNAEKWRDNPPTINREVNVLTTNLVLVMLVVALAELSVASAQQIKDGHLAGASYVQEAVHWLTSTWLNKCSTDLYLCQALFLAASWFNYACKPLEAWRMIHLASTNIQHAFLASSNRKTNPTLDPDLVRLCWAIFLTECDILAEYHLPRSGIENVVERLPYPGCHETPEFDSLAWLANLSARRLMNRVHFTMYDISTYNGGDADPGSRLPALNNLLDSDKASLLIASSKELDHQLHLWWDLLPPAIKPQFDESELDPIKETLSLRYFACGDIIYRPFIYKVCSMPCDRVPDRFLVDAAIKCIRYSREVLKHVACLTQTPSPNTMINLHSTLAALINLAVASLSPFLKEEVTDIDHLDDLAITILERWASDGSSRGIMLHVAKTIRDKRRMITAFDL